MPESFTRCVRRNGRVKTIKPRPDIYIKVCYPTGGGAPVHSEVHHVKKGAKDGK